ncbi:unnamed protein product [Adineta ricciae]|uniref:G-protein coupled receptors family 1 profile domain-containing protein n=1 Tax=Adineta ricciae TaxID=249248 RepID=A0A816DDF8_ADIRI|nr:unnamed protein product [Adineta ricciae]
MMNYTNDTLISSIIDDDSEFSRLFKLCIFTSISLLSIPLSITIIIHLYTKKGELRSLSDTILIILLLISLIDILCNQSGIIVYFALSYVWPSRSVYCLLWNYFNYLDYYLNLYLTVWASIERHILIFHHLFFDRPGKQLYFHKIPLIGIVSYGIFVYLGLIIFNPCTNHFQMSEAWCGGICFTNIPIEYFYDFVVNSVFPICAIIILNLSLLIRVINRKIHLKQNRITWKKCRKLTIQMITISSIYLICFLPTGIIVVLRNLLANKHIGEREMQICFKYTFLLANALLPYVTLSLLPNLRNTMKQLVQHARRIRIIKIRPIVTYM